MCTQQAVFSATAAAATVVLQLLLEKTAAGQENTMARKDGEASKIAPRKVPNVTSETGRK